MGSSCSKLGVALGGKRLSGFLYCSFQVTCRYHPEHLDAISHALRDTAQLVGQLLDVKWQKVQLGLGSFDDMVPNLSCRRAILASATRNCAGAYGATAIADARKAGLRKERATNPIA